MKASSIFCISAIAASTLIAFSTAALAISQPKNITANIELQSMQISEHPPLKISEKDDKSTSGRCPTGLEWLCGWW